MFALTEREYGIMNRDGSFADRLPYPYAIQPWSDRGRHKSGSRGKGGKLKFWYLFIRGVNSVYRTGPEVAPVACGTLTVLDHQQTGARKSLAISDTVVDRQTDGQRLRA